MRLRCSLIALALLLPAHAHAAPIVAQTIVSFDALGL
jgi:hypothetical protein